MYLLNTCSLNLCVIVFLHSGLQERVDEAVPCVRPLQALEARWWPHCTPPDTLSTPALARPFVCIPGLWDRKCPHCSYTTITPVTFQTTGPRKGRESADNEHWLLGTGSAKHPAHMSCSLPGGFTHLLFACFNAGRWHESSPSSDWTAEALRGALQGLR